MRTEGEVGVKNGQILRTSFMDGPFDILRRLLPKVKSTSLLRKRYGGKNVDLMTIQLQICSDDLAFAIIKVFNKFWRYNSIIK